MAIIRKERIQPYLDELDRYYQDLRRAIEGQDPDTNSCHSYQCEADQFVREYAEVDLDWVDSRLRHFKASVEDVKTLKKHVAKRAGR